MIVFVFFVLGLLVGSFATVVVGRYGSEDSIVSGRSKCPECGAQITWYDNIPVISFALLSGRCRGCGKSISWQYPATELVMGGIFALTASLMGFDATGGLITWLMVVLFCAIFAALVMIAVYDLRTMQIPMLIVWAALVLVVILISVQYFAQIIYDGELVSRIIGGLIGFGFLWFIAFISRERAMGAGDAYIGLIGGLLVGFSEVVFLLTVAFGLGAVLGICAILLRLASRKTAVPFAPFLIIATIITVLLPLTMSNIATIIPYFS